MDSGRLRRDLADAGCRWPQRRLRSAAVEHGDDDKQVCAQRRLPQLGKVDRRQRPVHGLALGARGHAGRNALAADASSAIALTTSWQRVTVSLTKLAAGASTLDFKAYVDAPAGSTCFY